MEKLKIPTMYHGTDARIVRMSQEELAENRKRCMEAALYFWQFYEPYCGTWRMDELKQYTVHGEDKKEYFDLCYALINLGGLVHGNLQYQYDCLYLTNSEERAARYARKSFAFGEIGLTVYRLYKAAKKINFNGWNPPEQIQKTMSWVEDFAEATGEPVIIKLEGLDPDYLKHDNGAEVKQSDLGSNWEESFRYTLPCILDLKNCIFL